MKNALTFLPRSALFALPLILFGCQEGAMPPYPTQESAPTLAIVSRDHAPKDLITVRLTNVTPGFIRYNLCRSSLERYSDGEWNTVQPTLAEACTAELRGLAPGQAAAFSFRVAAVPTRLMQYRVRTEIDTGARTRSAVVSNTFEIRRGRED